MAVIGQIFNKPLEQKVVATEEVSINLFLISGFKLDKDALKTRICVPKEIRNEGAAVVASYLKALKNGFTRLNESRLIILGDAAFR